MFTLGVVVTQSTRKLCLFPRNMCVCLHNENEVRIGATNPRRSHFQKKKFVYLVVELILPKMSIIENNWKFSSPNRFFLSLGVVGTNQPEKQCEYD